MKIFNGIKKLICKNDEQKKLFDDIKTVILVLFCSFLFLFLWVNRVKLSPDNVLLWIEGKAKSALFGPGYPCKIEGDKTYAENFKFSDGNLFILSDTAFTILNSSAKIVREDKHNFGHPCLKLGSTRGIIYDRGGKNFKIESCAKNISSGTTEKDIIGCAISDNGIYAIAQRSLDYLAELIIFNTNNKEKYKYSFSECYISDVSLNSAGTECAACGMSADNGNINSLVYIFDFKSETPKSQFKLNNNMIIRLEYMANGNILAIGDKYMAFINLKSKMIKNFPYDNKILKFYDFNKDYGICCCFSQSLTEINGDEIINLDTNGKELFCTQTHENISSLSRRKNRTVCLTKNKIISYGATGRNERSVDIQNHPQKILLAPHSYIYSLSGNAIEKWSI